MLVGLYPAVYPLKVNGLYSKNPALGRVEGLLIEQIRLNQFRDLPFAFVE